MEKPSDDGNCCGAEREFAARHSAEKRAYFARIVNVCLIIYHRAPCGPGYGQSADAPDECDVDCRCGRHARTPAVAERYVRLQDRARGRRPRPRSDWPSHVQFVVSVETESGERDLLCGADHTGFRDNAPTVRLWTDDVTELAVEFLGHDRVEEAAVEALSTAATIAYEIEAL